MSVRGNFMQTIPSRGAPRVLLPLVSRCFAESTWANHGRLFPSNFTRGDRIVSIIARVEFSDHISFLFSAAGENLPLICSQKQYNATLRRIYWQKRYLLQKRVDIHRLSGQQGDGKSINSRNAKTVFTEIYYLRSHISPSFDELSRYEWHNSCQK